LEQNVSSNDNTTTAPQLGYSTFDNDGNLCFIEYNEENNEGPSEKKVDKTKLIDLLEKDYKAITPLAQQSSFISELVVSVYAGGTTLSNKNEIALSEMQATHSKNLGFYKEMQEGFVKVAQSIIKKIIGVKLFFDQGNSKPRDNPKLLIANTSLDGIVKNKDRLKTFLKNVNGTLSKKYWFGIVPDISLTENQSTIDTTDENLDDLDDIDISFDNDDKKDTQSSALSKLKVLIDICEETKLMTFFNFSANEETGFEKLNEEKISGYEAELESINSEYAVFAFPNFTLLPADRSLVAIGKDNSIDESGSLTNRQVKLVLNGFYIDASYVAAGLVVAYQTPNILKTKGIKVLKNNPVVRFNLEEGDNSLKFTSSLGIENLLNWTEDIKQVINENSFGFSFCSDNVFLDGNAIKNAFVYTSRTLGKDKDKYKGIYKVLTRDFIYSYIKEQTNGKLSKVKNFIKLDIGREWNKKKDQENEPDYANLILRKGDELSLGDYDDESKIQGIKLVFDKEEEIVEININE